MIRIVDHLYFRYQVEKNIHILERLLLFLVLTFLVFEK